MRRALGLLAAAVLLVAGSADAKPIQVAALTATSHVQTWESRQFGEHAVVFVRVYVSGHELQQTSGRCSGTYSGRGVAVHVRLENCGRPGLGRYVIRYVSFGGPRRAVVRLAAYRGSK